MLKAMADLMSLSLDKDKSLVVTEFSHKYSKCFVRIDGLLCKIEQITFREGKLGGSLSVYDVDSKSGEYKLQDTIPITPETQAKKIEDVLPKTGLYRSIYGLLYLYRLPARQWCKSLRKGANYDYSILNAVDRQNIKNAPNITNTILNQNVEYHEETLDDALGNLYLHWVKVGKINHSEFTINLTKTEFEKEIAELWPRYKIILGAKVPRVRQDERLQMPF